MTRSYNPLQVCLTVLPLFLLTLSGWISGILFVSVAISLWYLYADYKMPSLFSSEQSIWLRRFFIVLALPVFAIFMAQLLRHHFAWRDYDSPARFLLTIPILLTLTKSRIDPLKTLSYSIPCAIFITFIAVTLNINAWWDKDRISTYFVDPLTFGSLNLTLGLLSLLSIDLFERDVWLVRVYKALGFVLAIYLSVLSGSRTGWLALPIVLFLWLNYKSTGYRYLPITIMLLLPIAGYYSSETLQLRLNAAIQDLIAYNWNAENPQTSIGDRISFLRIALFLFAQHPLEGFGDQGFAAYINHPELNRFAIQGTQEFALHAGFHNEIATNMIRSGIWGLVSSSMLFLMPAIFFIKQLRSSCLQTQKIALLAIAYLLSTFISGMTTEVFNLKFTASFHALMLTCFISALLQQLPFAEESTKHESP